MLLLGPLARRAHLPAVGAAAARAGPPGDSAQSESTAASAVPASRLLPGSLPAPSVSLCHAPPAMLRDPRPSRTLSSGGGSSFRITIVPGFESDLRYEMRSAVSESTPREPEHGTIAADDISARIGTYLFGYFPSILRFLSKQLK